MAGAQCLALFPGLFTLVGWREKGARMLVTERPSGMSLIEVLMGTVILSIIGTAFSHQSASALKQQHQSNTTFNAELIRRMIVTHLNDREAWQKTISDSPYNTNLECLHRRTSCLDKGGSFRLRDRANNIVYDPTNRNAGFSNGMQPCDAFDEANGNDACPLRLELKWTPVCTGSCVSPLVKVTGTFIYKSKSSKRASSFNPANYGFEVTLGGNEALDWSNPHLVYATASGNRQVNAGVHKLCFLKTAGVNNCGRCHLSRNTDGSWILDQASCNNRDYIWCEAMCFD